MLWMSVAGLQGPEAGMRQCRRLLSRLCALQEPRLDIRAVTLSSPAALLPEERSAAPDGMAGAGITWVGVDGPPGCSRGQLPLACLEALHERYLQELACWHPDLVLGTGCSPVERCLFREAAAHGIPAAYCLYAGVPPDYAFPGCQRVLTGPPAFAGFCSELYGINVAAADDPGGADGGIREAQPEAAGNRPPRVLCPDPGPGAALAWLVRLALMARVQLPELRIELAGSPGDWERQVAGLRDPCSRQTPCALQLDNVVPAAASGPGAGHERCRVLLAADASPRTVGLALEAAERGLDVLGPLCPEAAAGTCLPPPALVQPWLERLRSVLTAAPAGAMPGQDRTGPQEGRLLAVLAPLLRLGAGDDGRSWRGGGPGPEE